MYFVYFTMIRKHYFFFLTLLPITLYGVEFFSHAMGQHGLAWLDLTLFTDTLNMSSQNTCVIRGYHTSFIKEGGFQIRHKKKKITVGLDGSFQFHNLLASQDFALQMTRHLTPHLAGFVSLNWTRASPAEARTVHEFSLSWRLMLHPLPDFYTSLGYDFLPGLSLPKERFTLNSPAWFGTIGKRFLSELLLTAGVYCRDGFLPDWGLGASFNPGPFMACNTAWFSLSKAVHASFSLFYRSWSFQWQCRWHPSVGLCYGSSVCREF
ncbi:MAG: hypothetical protein PWP06_712 [Candidatus Marinimicrobia bacterium]|jgi:hypothetical protein|nr:hypothetical protein [Candidatus Neomarinimicrobiota bacterium]